MTLASLLFQMMQVSCIINMAKVENKFSKKKVIGTKMGNKFSKLKVYTNTLQASRKG
jgi:hypothetical protein